MTYEEATEARVTEREALRELFKHGFACHVDGNKLVSDWGELVAKRGKDGLFSGADILAWLGY